MNYCPNCGTKLQEGAKYCINCGAPIEAVPQPIKAEKQRPTGLILSIIALSVTILTWTLVLIWCFTLRC